MRRAAAVLAFLAGDAMACQVLEFAELESLKREQLLQIRCEYRDDSYRWTNLAGDELRKGSTRTAELGLVRATRCGEQIARLDRILIRKYSLQGGAVAEATKLEQMCGPPPAIRK